MSDFQILSMMFTKPDDRPPDDWKRVDCSRCHRQCWLTLGHQITLKLHPGSSVAYCKECAVEEAQKISKSARQPRKGHV